MPFANIEDKRAYQRRWCAQRRFDYFKDKVCVDCGAPSSEKPLELDHRDPSQKLDHKIWSWSEERRLAEIAKCDPRCVDCHREKSKRFNEQHGWSRVHSPYRNAYHHEASYA